MQIDSCTWAPDLDMLARIKALIGAGESSRAEPPVSDAEAVKLLVELAESTGNASKGFPLGPLALAGKLRSCANDAAKRTDFPSARYFYERALQALSDLRARLHCGRARPPPSVHFARDEIAHPRQPRACTTRAAS